jgi:hypothetical protein
MRWEGHPGHQQRFCGPGRLEGETKGRGPHLNRIKLPGRRERARSEEGFARADAAMIAGMLPPRTGIHDRPMLRPKEQAPPPGNPLQRRLGLKSQYWREGAHAIRSGRSSAGSRCRGVVSRKCERHNRITRPWPDAGWSARPSPESRSSARCRPSGGNAEDFSSCGTPRLSTSVMVREPCD